MKPAPGNHLNEARPAEEASPPRQISHGASSGLILNDSEADRFCFVEDGRRMLVTIIAVPDRNAESIADLNLTPRRLCAHLRLVITRPDVPDEGYAQSVLLRIVPQLCA